MVTGYLRQIASACRNLNPETVRAMAERPVRFGVLAADELCADQIHDLLCEGPGPSGDHPVLRIASDADFARATVGFAEQGIPHPAHFYEFDQADPNGSLAALLAEREDDWLLLARNFPGLRRQVSERLIWKISKENALFTVATSLPNVVPTIVSLPWVVGEFASDTAFLTMNQVRLSFLLAAAHHREVGYGSQGLKVGSIVGGAFGWRALARQIVSKVPAGGGVVTKGVVAFAGTYAVGRAIEHWMRVREPLGSAARRAHYERVRETAKETVDRIVGKVISGSATAEGAV